MNPTHPDSLRESFELLENAFKLEHGPFHLENTERRFLSFAAECQKADVSINDFHFSLNLPYPFLIFLIFHINTTESRPRLTEKQAQHLMSLHLVHGGDVDARTQESNSIYGLHGGTTALHFAAQRGLIATSLFLIEHQADVNLQDDEGFTVLHFAAKLNNTNLTRHLLSLPQLSILETKYFHLQHTPLMSAILNSNFPNFLELLNHGANLFHQSFDLRNPLHRVGSDDKDLRFARIFISQGVSLTELDNRNHTPLDTCIYFTNQPLLELLIEHGYPSKISITDLQNTYDKGVFGLSG